MKGVFEIGKDVGKLLDELGVRALERHHTVTLDRYPTKSGNEWGPDMEDVVGWPAFLESEFQNGVYEENKQDRVEILVYPDHVIVRPWYGNAPKVEEIVAVNALTASSLSDAIINTKEQILTAAAG